MKMKPIKRIFGMAMSAVMLLSSVTAVSAATVYHTNQKLEIQNNYRIPFLLFNGVEDIANFAPAQVGWTNPATNAPYQAYCINPAYSGYGDVADYGIDIEKFDDSSIVDAGGSGGAGKTAGSASAAGNTVAAFLEGAVNYGFPTVSAEELMGASAADFGVSQNELDYAAYLATKLAIWSGIHDSYSINAWSENTGVSYSSALRKAVLNATKDIYAKAGSYTPSDGTSTVTFTAGEPKLSGSNYEVVYTIGNTGNNVPNSDMYIEMQNGGAFTNGVTICDMDGNEYPMTTTSGGNERYIIPDGTTEVKVVLPDPGEAGATVELRLYAQQMKKILLYGRSLQDATQSYILAGGHYDNPFDSFTIGEAGDPPDEPTTPTTPTTPTGKLKVIKLDARDNATPLAGVTFDCYDSSGKLIDTGTTDNSGTWIPEISGAGTYTIIERDSGDSYQLTEPTSLVITVQPEQEATATFRDYPTTTVTLEKEDAVTGEPIAGVQYEIMQIDGKGAWRATGKTDASGKITWDDVLDGTYLVREVSTIEGYILDPTPQYVTVRNGQAPSLKFLNSKFPSLNILKVDKQTGAVIDSPATFKVEQVDGNYTTTVETKNGAVSLQNIPVGSYKITELSAPEGYVLDGCAGTIYMGENESKQYIAYNLKTPVLTIEKIDGQTGAPVSGTKFEIKKSDGTKIGTVETGADGKVTIGMKGGDLGYLEPDTYTVTEVFVPEPYVLSGEHQDIQLKAGDTKTLLFANLEAPVITVEKYDEKTGEKLEGAQFAIYEQADLSRPVAEGMTDADGKFTSGHVAPGTYVVTELNPPPGYMFSEKTSPNRVIVAKAGDGEIVVKVDNIKLPELTIKKVDSITKEPIAGVTYKVSLVDDTSVEPATVTTDVDGIISLIGLQAGTYEITEISTPHPYILNSTPQRVKLEGGDVKTLLFENTKYPTLVIQKTDGTTNKGIPNTTYKVEHEQADGGIKTVGTFKTDKNGRITLPYVEVGWYIITETIPAQGYQKPTNPVTRVYLSAGDNSYLDADDTANSAEDVGVNNAAGIITSTGMNTANSSVTITSGKDYPVVGDIVNYPLNSLVIKKADANTGKMLDGATFEVIRVTGETSGQNGTLICTVTTDHSGVIVITGLEAGAYAVREIKAPANYIIAETDRQTVNLKADRTSVVEVIFRNLPYGSLLISKTDAATNTPLAGAKFKVTTNDGAVVGNDNGVFTTNNNGEILIPNLEPNSYVVTELEAPKGYVRDTEPQTVKIGTDGGTYKVSFKNQPESTLVILKKDADSHAPLAGAQFKVTTSKGDVVGTTNGIFTSDNNGAITISGLAKGSYIVEEIKAPTGYALEEQSRTIAIDYGKTYTMEFTNKKLTSLIIKKIDSETAEPLAGAKFFVEKQNGEDVGEYTTDRDGTILLPALVPDWYVVKETKAPDGYILDETPKTVEIKTNVPTTVTFSNKRLTSLVIKKIDSETGEPLAGAKFFVEKQNGEHVGEYTTDRDGAILIPTLAPDWYVVKETKAPDRYILDETPKTVEVKTNVPTTVTFSNKPLSGIKIIKTDSESNAPLEGVTFSVAKMNGEKIGNFQTDKDGMIYVDGLKDGWYTVTETKGLDGYHWDEEPKTVEVKSGRQTIVEVENDPYSCLVIEKTSESTGEPIQGAEFLITKLNGEQIGYHKTNESGLIVMEGLDEGTYLVKETAAAEGYLLDSEAREVQIIDGERTTLKVENDPLSSILIHKVDSVTGEGIFGVKFLLYDADNNPIGQFETDDQGYIHIEDELPEGQYKLRELEPADGYLRDDVPRTFYVKKGKTTEIRWENIAQMGQIQITKKSSDDNPYNGFPAGTLLEGAVFEIYTRAGNLVDTMVTDKNGKAFSKTLPLGRYVIRETKAPDFYGANAAEIEAEIEHVGQIVRLEVLNSSLYTNVAVNKKGYAEVAPNQSIRYEFTGIKNNSTVSLNSFYWRDSLPFEAVRLDKIVTGTWNQRLSYKIVYKTNLHDYRTLADNLDTAKNNVIAASPAALELPSNEYVTEVMFVFGTVKSGFAQVETPYIYCNVLPTVTHEQRFTNSTDVGGLHQGQWIMSNDRWVTVVYGKIETPKLPRTGY